MHRPFLAATTCLAILGVAAGVAAQRPNATGDEAGRRERALLLLDESAALYDQGRFLDAADMLRRAHELFPEPALLFNLGRALESAGHEQGALDAYGRYLEAEPASERRAQVEARMTTLERQLALEGAAQQGGAGGQGEGLPADEPDGEGGGGAIVGPVVLMAAGGAAVVVGVALGVAAGARQDDALAPGVSMEEGAAIDDEAHGLATGANVLLVVGALAVAAGVGWLLLAGDDEPGEVDAPAVTLRLELGPAAARLRGHF